MPNNWAGPYRGRQIPVLTAEALAEREHQRPFAERPQGWDAVGATLRGAFDVSPLGTALAWARLPPLAPQTLAGTASDHERRRFADRIPEAEWAASDWVRPGLTWEPGMPRSRARFKAQHYDDQRLYEALAADNPLLDIIAGTLVYLISRAAAAAWEAAGLSGARFESIPIQKSDVFEDDHPEITMPPFVLLAPTGTPGQDDLGAVADGDSVMSERAIAVVKPFGLKNATFEPYEPA